MQQFLNNNIRFLTKLLLLLTGILSVYAIGIWMQNDGIVIEGTGEVAGIYQAGQAFNHNIRIINLTSHSVDVSNYPTCGCIEIEKLDVTIKPFTQIDIPMKYRVHEKTDGRKFRKILLVYKSRNRIHRIEREIYFNVQNKV